MNISLFVTLSLDWDKMIVVYHDPIIKCMNIPPHRFTLLQNYFVEPNSFVFALD